MAVPASGSLALAQPNVETLAYQRELINAISQAEGSVVCITRIRTDPAKIQIDITGQGKGDPSNPDFIPNEFGTGVLIRAPQGRLLVLTNYHVVRGGPATSDPNQTGTSRLYVRLSNRQGYYATIYAADPRSDLAVLTVDREAAGDLQPITLGKADNLKKGELVLTLGNPYAIARDGSPSASLGMISNIARRPMPLDDVLLQPELRKQETIHHLGTLLQIDGRLNLGTSGGALINLKGELIGVTTSLAALEGYEKSAGYAIPLDSAMLRVIQELAQGFEVEYGFLGMSPSDYDFSMGAPNIENMKQTSGVLVTNLFPGSPGDMAGLEVGDLILEIDGTPTETKYDLMRDIGLRGPSSGDDEQVTLRVWRQRTSSDLQLQVKLGKWPVYDDEGIIATNSRHPSWAGLTIDYPTARSKFLDQTQLRFHHAVMVTEILNQSPLKDVLQPGTLITRVNGQLVNTPRKFFQQIAGQKTVTLTLIDGRNFTLNSNNGNWTLQKLP